MSKPAPMQAMVLAAGRGERMRPLTDHTPKPLLKVNNKPLLVWHLEALSRAGFESVVINVAHLGQQIQGYVGDGQRYGLEVRYSVEPQGALETAGGIAQAAPWCDSAGHLASPHFLVVNADVWTDWPMARAFAIRDQMAASAGNTRCHLVLIDNPVQHPDGDFSLASGQVLPRRPGDSLTFSGIGVYDHRIFKEIRAGTRAPLAPLLHQAIAQGQCSGEHYDGIWSDVGTPERLAQLNQ